MSGGVGLRQDGREVGSRRLGVGASRPWAGNRGLPREDNADRSRVHTESCQQVVLQQVRRSTLRKSNIIVSSFRRRHAVKSHHLTRSAGGKHGA